ncbi:P-loop containing nucleoside triphosphate hydrolase protein [Whalleya microplaca]|nr:P-loop containing nucleoside triphosphate hydrolase protein [Whalleya microplaca]
MKKFGFGKKPADGDDANRSALFGKRGSPAPSNDNPYAQPQAANDPYAGDNNKYAHMTPYQQARKGLPSGPGPQSGYGAPALSRNDSHSSSATAPPAYPNGPASAGYANDKYGTASGYGSSKYGNSNNYGSAPSLGASRPGGYGGLGRTDSNNTDVNRDALFSGARERHDQSLPNQQNGGYGASGANSDTSKYGGYGEQRELTAEEEEEEEYRAKKKTVDKLTGESVGTSSNVLNIADQSIETALATYARLGAQSERLHNAEHHLDAATQQQHEAVASTKKLKSLNRSMLAVHVKNPFTEKRRTAEAEARIIAQNKADREIREATRRDKFAQNARMESKFRELNRDQVPESFSRPNDDKISKYLFLDDSDEEGAKVRREQNEIIENNLDATHGRLKTLNHIARAMGEELDQSNKVIERIGHKADPLDDSLKANTQILKNNFHRRKIKATNDASVVKIGDKTISLSAYLQPQKDAPERLSIDTQSTAAAESQQQPAKEVKPETHRYDTPKRHTSSQNPTLLDFRKALPIWAHQKEIKSGLRDDNDVLLIVGETGSGKSTQVPQFLCDEPWCRRKKVKVQSGVVGVGGMIAVTQPRRVAATTLASRVAREMGTPLGSSRDGHVGYSVRFDHSVPKSTKIKFLTEGMLLQELLRDPNLRQYSAIIVDEIHERSVDVDLIAGFLKQILSSDKSGRGGIPLKVVVMSATADVKKIQDFFRTQESNDPIRLLQIKGRQYSVEVKYTDNPIPDIQEALLQQIFTIHLHEPLPGDILVFLTGQEEIEAAQRLIEEYCAKLASDMPKLLACPLYGQLSIQAQQDVFRPAKKSFTRKVVLATNIAETSVTVPGVRYVIDCGKAKVKQFRSRLGMESLLAKAISKSSAIQRTGRAGRVGPGKCYRMYTSETYDSLQEADLPEILRNDILGAILTMKTRGINDILSFPLMDFPGIESVEKALIHLHFLGALADDGTITQIGKKLALFPISAPYGRVLLAASEPQYDCLLEVIDIISCITSGENIFYQLLSEEVKEEVEEYRRELYRREGDILTYLTTMQRYTAENSDRIEWCKKRKINIRNMKQALNIRKQLRGICLKGRMLPEVPAPDPQPFVPMSPERAAALLKCFMKGFGTKCALLAPDSSYVTIQGKHVVAIHPSSVLHGQKKEAIMFLEHVFTQKNYAKKVSAIQADWILEVM